MIWSNFRRGLELTRTLGSQRHYISSARGCCLVKRFHYHSRKKIEEKIEKLRSAIGERLKRSPILVLLFPKYVYVRSDDGTRWISAGMFSTFYFSRSYVHELVFHYFLPSFSFLSLTFYYVLVLFPPGSWTNPHSRFLGVITKFHLEDVV